jgi:hypothetical protein
MKVSWADVNHTETPGKFRLFGGVVEVRETQIAVWKTTPTALFTAIRVDGINDPERQFVLGTYDVPGEK